MSGRKEANQEAKEEVGGGSTSVSPASSDTPAPGSPSVQTPPVSGGGLGTDRPGEQEQEENPQRIPPLSFLDLGPVAGSQNEVSQTWQGFVQRFPGPRQQSYRSEPGSILQFLQQRAQEQEQKQEGSNAKVI